MYQEISQTVQPEFLHICRQLGRTRLKDCYYLAGGINLALQMKHRTADDLIFFSINPSTALDAVSILKLLKLVLPESNIKIDLKLSHQLDVFIDHEKVSFITNHYPLLNPPLGGSVINAELTGINLASVQDMALIKAFNIIRKPSFDDYVDLYFLLQTNTANLTYILNNAHRKFVSNNQSDFSAKVLLERLRTPQELSDKNEAVSKILGAPLKPQEIESYLEKAILKYIKERI